MQQQQNDDKMQQQQNDDEINNYEEIESFPSTEVMLQQKISFGKFTEKQTGQSSAPSIVNNEIQPINFQIGDFVKKIYFTMPFGIGIDGPREINGKLFNGVVGERNTAINLSTNDEYTMQFLNKIQEITKKTIVETGDLIFKDIEWVDPETNEPFSEKEITKAKYQIVNSTLYKIVKPNKDYPQYTSFNVKINSLTGSRNETKLYYIREMEDNQVSLESETWENFLKTGEEPLKRPLRCIINVSISSIWMKPKTTGVVIYAKSIFINPQSNNYSSNNTLKLFDLNKKKRTSTSSTKNEKENSPKKTKQSENKNINDKDDKEKEQLEQYMKEHQEELQQEFQEIDEYVEENAL